MKHLLLGLCLLLHQIGIDNIKPNEWNNDSYYPIGSLIKYHNICFRAFAETTIGKAPLDSNSILDDSVWALYVDHTLNAPCNINIHLSGKKKGIKHGNYGKGNKKSHK